MHVKHCKVSKKEQLRLIECFVAGTPARTAADLVGVHRNSAIRFFHKLREKIALKQQNRSWRFNMGSPKLLLKDLKLILKEFY